MSIFTSLFEGLKAGLEAILRMYETLLEPVIGSLAWGVSIILLTLTVRLFLVPLAIRQTKSMRSMQKVQPELKKIQKKYEADRGLMKTDPERYKQLKEKQREAQMALYKEHNVNPAGGCLPLLLQMPVFFALFSILRPEGDSPRIPELADAGFFGIDSLTGTAAAGAGIGAIVLVILQIATTYWSTKQMQGRNTQAAPEQQQAQKLMMYIMPAFLGYLSWTFPIGVVLYWVTTNVWTIGQQAFIFKQVETQEKRAEEERSVARDEARAQRRTRQSGAAAEVTADAPKRTRGGASPKTSTDRTSMAEGDGPTTSKASAPKASAPKASAPKSSARNGSAVSPSATPGSGRTRARPGRPQGPADGAARDGTAGRSRSRPQGQRSETDTARTARRRGGAAADTAEDGS